MTVGDVTASQQAMVDVWERRVAAVFVAKRIDWAGVAPVVRSRPFLQEAHPPWC